MGTQKLWLAVGVAVLALVMRWWGLGEIMTVDEERWVLRSSDYYENMFDENDTGGAFQTTHPGATGMWIMGAGVRLQETRLGYQADEANISDFHRAAKAPVAVATSVLVGLVVYVLVGLVGPWAASAAGVLLATDPYVTGMSQIAHLDALLTFCMLLSVVLFLRATRARGFPVWYLVGSGMAAGLALGTKGLPALWLGVTWGLILLAPVAVGWHHSKRRGKKEFLAAVRTWFFTAGVAALVFYLVWPALWTTADLGQSVVRDYGQVVTDAHTEIEKSEEPIAPASFYVRSLFGRLTPLVMLLTIAVIVGVGRAWWRERRMPVVGWMIVYAVGYVVLVSLAAKKGDRYALPAMAALVVVAGIGLAAAARVWWEARPGQRKILQVVVATVLAALIGQYWVWQPHAIAYNNPVFPDVRPRTQQGWGEGLELAAAWLNERPFIDRLSIASWYPSVMSVWFEGRTFSLSSREDHRVGYVVLYRNMEDRAEDDIASNVLDEFGRREPEKVFYVGGQPYVWIYNVLGPYYFRSHVEEITRQVEAGQIVPVERDRWRRIDLAFATFSGRNNTEDVIVEIKERPDSEEILRRMVVNAGEVPDEDWQMFDFEPIADSGGKEYYVSVRSPSSVPGNAITVRLAPEDVMPGQAVVRRRALQPGEQQSDFTRTGDLGYRIFYEQ